MVKKSARTIKKRNVFLVYLFYFLTFGIYGLYWFVSTKRDICSKGADIPPVILIFIPIANIFWVVKYAIGFSEHVKKDDNKALWVVLFLLFSIIIPGVVQSNLNKIA